MNPEARSYLSPTHETFWHWKDNGEVVAWKDGKTIAFRAEIHQILRRLAPRGLPRFGAVILLLAATRDSWQEAATEPGILSAILSNGDSYDLVRSEVLADVLGGLDKVSMLETDLRTDPDAKEVMVELVFEGLQERGSLETANQVVDILGQGLGEEVLFRQDGRQTLDTGARELQQELKNLQQGIHRVQADVLKSRIETGLDNIPGPIDLDLTLAERVRTLLAAIRNDDELCGLANLAFELMAAVTLPRKVSAPDEMPMGGISDISNRGPLDRLLLSELAHDDLTLAVRVAVNEALYLRREPPPKTPSQQRAILLEAGLRSWGVPRVFATAVALALAASVDKNNDVVAYRAKGCNAEPVDLTTRTGLLSHLEALEPELHPGSALTAFKNQMLSVENASEPVLVTTEDVLADTEFQLAMTKDQISPILIATVTREGRFRLLERTVRGTRLLREANLELDELFTDPKRIVPTLINRDWARELPAILSVEPFPLLLPHNVDPERTWSVGDKGVLALSRDRRLMWWQGTRYGARQLSDEIPKGKLWWALRDPTDYDRAQAVIGHSDSRALHLLDVDFSSNRCTLTPLAVDQTVKGICSHSGALFIIYRHEVRLYDEDAGEFTKAFRFPTDLIYRRDRFFRSVPGEQWYALSFDGMNGQFDRVFAADDLRRPKLQAMFETEGVDGPVGVTERGDLYSTATGDLRKVHHGLSRPRVQAISSDGKRIVLAEPGARFNNVLVDVDLLTTKPTNGNPTEIAENGGKHSYPVNLRTRFTYIFVDDHGVLTLTSKKQRNFAIDYDPDSDRIRLRPNVGCRARGKKLTFKQVKLTSRVGYRLTVATWDDGSQAFLDSRGLLHLRSSDPQAVPETTIILKDGELSGWCADGRVWGSSYFLGDRKTSPKNEVYESAIQAFAERAV